MSPRRWLTAHAADPRRGILVLGAVFIAAIVGLAGYDIVRSYRATVDDTGRELKAEARVVAEQAARSIQAVDVVLRHLAEQQRRGAFDRLSPAELHALLREQAVGLVQADGLALHDAQGNARAVSWVEPTPPISSNPAARAAFQVVRETARGDAFVGEALRSPDGSIHFFPIARRLTTSTGEFAGTVTARGRIDYFQHFYRDARPDTATAITLMHSGGTLLARYPPAEAALGQPFPLLTELLAAAAAGRSPVRAASPIDGVDRFGAVYAVPDYPLVVAVTRDSAAALGPWREQAIGSGLRTLALAGIALLLLGVVLRQLRRIDSTRRSLEVSRERYALAAAGADDGIWDWDLAAGTAYESARARELQGLPPGPETQPLAELQGSLTYHPDDAPRRSAALQAHLDGHTPAYEIDYRVRHADGVYRWIRVRALCIRDADGKPCRIAGSVSDIDATKRVEVALRESERRFAVAVAGSDDGIWEWDYDSDTAFASHRAREINGMPPGPETQSIASWFEQMEAQLHPDDRPRRRAALEDHLAGRTPAYEGEFRVRAGDGAYRWIHVHGMCMRDDTGRAQCIAGSVSDIDSRKRSEDALRLSEERYAIATTGSHEGHWVWTLADNQVYISGLLAEIFDLEPGQRVSTLNDFFSKVPILPEDYDRVYKAVRDHIDGKTPRLDIEYRIQRRGEIRWVANRAMCFRDASGKAERMAGATVDVTERHHAEAALRESEERYQLAVDGSNEGLWDWDLASDRLFLSPRAQEILWQKPGEPVRPRREWIAMTPYHPDDVEPVRRAIAEHLRGTTPHFAVEYRLRHHSGEWNWYRQRGVALRDSSGRPYRMAGSMENISARKSAEAERDRLELQLRQAQKLEAIGTLAGGIAHDFNNILSAILGYGELAQKDAAEGTALRRHIDASLAAGLRAKSLVERILAFSRSGMAERVPVHVQSVVVEALDGIAASLPASVRLVRRVAAGDAGVMGDPTQIHQVVMNLCANAVQAMRAEGTLEVGVDVCRLEQPQMVSTCTLPPGPYVRLAVRDTGTGIAAAVLERIFDPFFTTKDVGVGTGLGLSLVHGIVGDLGGGVAVESQPGEGALFTVYLPSQSYVAAPVATEEEVAPGAGETVLLVDDEEALVRLGEETLAELGYEPVGFTSSTAALEAFRADPDRFQAVLSDEAMPGMTGSELVAEIRRLRPAVPVVLMSGYVSAALTQRARDAGVADILSKPLAARDIARSLAAALRQHRVADTERLNDA